jgi:hypothetical protein
MTRLDKLGTDVTLCSFFGDYLFPATTYMLIELFFTITLACFFFLERQFFCGDFDFLVSGEKLFYDFLNRAFLAYSGEILLLTLGETDFLLFNIVYYLTLISIILSD